MDLKDLAARRALETVQDGMVLGLGTGSTTARFIEHLSQALRAGRLHNIRAVPTSQRTEGLARSLKIPLTNLKENPRLDLAVDGADEVDPSLNLIKGLGRALLREKIVAVYADCFVVMVDQSKLVARLGSHGPLPVEMVRFEIEAQVEWLNKLGCRAEQWFEEDGTPVVTDNENYLARCWFEAGIADPYGLAELLAHRPGIVEHGLFLDMAHRVIIAGEEGVRIMERNA